MSNAEKALQLAERIVMLRAELKAAEREFFALHEEKPSSRQVAPAVHSTEEIGGVSARLRRFFGENAGKTFAVSDIGEQFSDIDIKTIRSTLVRLAKNGGGLESVSRGYYRLNGGQRS